MFCTTECWDCEDKKCEHYISKREYYFENQRLKSIIEELEKYLCQEYMFDGYEELYKIGIKDCYNKLKELKEKNR